MPGRLIILVRHADSTKNQLARFSLSAGADELTPAGTGEIFHLGNRLDQFCERRRYSRLALFCAPSARARLTASLLADRLKTHSVELPNFDSISSGPHAGMSESEVAADDPEFITALSLYRAGLLSSYDIPLPEGAEQVRDFEKRIIEALVIAENVPEELVVIVGHRSPITASLIHFARRASSYPRNFYGYVPLHTGATSCISLREGKVRMPWVNAMPHIDLSLFE